mgnify:CR=1 FL=1
MLDPPIRSKSSGTLVTSRSGNAVQERTSVVSGFDRAFLAIIDANITTIIAAVVLYIFGTGTIKGFAVTLGLGIIISMLSAVFGTHYMLKAPIGLNIRNPKLYGASMRGGNKDA